jgi:hypothetical protein
MVINCDPAPPATAWAPVTRQFDPLWAFGPQAEAPVALTLKKLDNTEAKSKAA